MTIFSFSCTNQLRSVIQNRTDYHIDSRRVWERGIIFTTSNLLYLYFFDSSKASICGSATPVSQKIRQQVHPSVLSAISKSIDQPVRHFHDDRDWYGRNGHIHSLELFLKRFNVCLQRRESQSWGDFHPPSPPTHWYYVFITRNTRTFDLGVRFCIRHNGVSERDKQRRKRGRVEWGIF